MVDTVEKSPSTFHLKNRGIIYRCDKFEFDNAKRVLRVTIPRHSPTIWTTSKWRSEVWNRGRRPHFEVIQQTSARPTN